MLWVSVSKVYKLVLGLVKTTYANVVSEGNLLLCRFLNLSCLFDHCTLSSVDIGLVLFRSVKVWKLEIGSLNVRNGTFLLELCGSIGVQFRKRLGADPAKKMVRMVGSWHAQEVVCVMLQNRLPEEWRWWGRGCPGTASASPTGKAAAEARGRILGAGDRPGGGSRPEQVLSSSEWKMSKLLPSLSDEWNVLGKTFPSRPNSKSWLVFSI